MPSRGTARRRDDRLATPAEVLDYAKGIADLPTTNLLKYKLADSS